jgi:hypothetical protein
MTDYRADPTLASKRLVNIGPSLDGGTIRATIEYLERMADHYGDDACVLFLWDGASHTNPSGTVGIYPAGIGESAPG